MQAVLRLAANAGIVVPTPALTGTTSTPSANGDRLKIAGGVLVGIVVFLVVFFAPRIRRKASS